MNRISQGLLIAIATTVTVGLTTNALGVELKDTAITQIGASVLHVDKENRQLLVIELEGIVEAEPAETTSWLYRTYSVNKKVATFDYVREGDKVILDVTTSLAIAVRKPTDEEGQSPYQSHTVTTKKGVLQHEITAVCEVAAVDKETDRITFRGPRGKLFRVRVSEDFMLEVGQIGDQVVVTYSQSEIVGLSRAD